VALAIMAICRANRSYNHAAPCMRVKSCCQEVNHSSYSSILVIAFFGLNLGASSESTPFTSVKEDQPYIYAPDSRCSRCPFTKPSHLFLCAYPTDCCIDKVVYSYLILVSPRNCLFCYGSSIVPAHSKLQIRGRLKILNLVDDLRYSAEVLTFEDCPFTPVLE
jgi:hypothetical protein